MQQQHWWGQGVPQHIELVMRMIADGRRNGALVSLRLVHLIPMAEQMRDAYADYIQTLRRRYAPNDPPQRLIDNARVMMNTFHLLTDARRALQLINFMRGRIARGGAAMPYYGNIF